MLLISCGLFLPLVRFHNILPSSMSLNSTSWHFYCARDSWRKKFYLAKQLHQYNRFHQQPSHLRFRCFIALAIQQSSMTLLRTSELLTFAVQLIFSILLYSHISYATIFYSVLDIVQVSAAYKATLHTRHLIILFLKYRLILPVATYSFALANPILLLICLSQYWPNVPEVPPVSTTEVRLYGPTPATPYVLLLPKAAGWWQVTVVVALTMMIWWTMLVGSAGRQPAVAVTPAIGSWAAARPVNSLHRHRLRWCERPESLVSACCIQTGLVDQFL